VLTTRLGSILGALLCLAMALPCRAQSSDADAAPARAPRASPPKAQTAAPASETRPPVTFSVAEDSDREDLSIYLEKGINPILGSGGNVDLSVFEPLCRAPCEVDLRSGTHLFAVSAGPRATVRTDAPVLVRRGEHVVVHYDSRLGLRIAGWTLLITGASAGGLLTALGTPLYGDTDRAKLVGGSLLTVVGLVGGLWLANMPDRARAWVR
jgi:hypothetical protein